MKRTAIFLIAILLLPMLCMAQYKVVIKKTGKVLDGKLVWEDDQIVRILSSGLEVTYKKELLDLEKMKQLNANYVPPTAPKTITIGPDAPLPAAEPSLVELAKQLQASRTGKAKRTFKEGDKPGSVELGDDSNEFSDSEKALIQKRIDELQKKIAAGGSANDLDSAKKELAQRQEELGGGKDTLVKHYIQSQIDEYQDLIDQTDKQLSDAVQAKESQDTIQSLRDKLQGLKAKVADLQEELKQMQQ